MERKPSFCSELSSKYQKTEDLKKFKKRVDSQHFFCESYGANIVL